MGGGGAGASAAAHHGAALPHATRLLPSVIPGKLIVGFRQGASRADRRSALARANASAGEPLGSNGMQLISVPAGATARTTTLLEGNPDVRFVEPDRRITIDAVSPPNDTLFARQWGLNNTGQVVDFTAGTPGDDVGALRAWGVTTGKKSIIVAVIDSGTDMSHTDLAANIWTNTGENCTGCHTDGIDNDHNGFVDDWRGWDWVNNDNNPSDDNGHGTHVAGIIGAVGNNKKGVAGENWNVQLMPLKFVGADGTGDLANAVLAINYATAMGARVINASWGDTEYSQALYDAIANADAHGVLFVTAAGNDGEDNDTSPHYPANFDLPNVIAVGATDSSDNLAYFSDYGRDTVDIAAPGVSIYSTWPGNQYKSDSGTSMASPYVAGAAALVLAAHSGASPATIKALLMKTADHPAALAGTSESSGRLDAGNALTCSGSPQVIVDSPGPGFVAVPGHPVAVRIEAGVCGAPSGVTVSATGGGSPIALTARGDGVYTGSYTPAGAGSTTITANATAKATSATDTNSVTGTTPAAIAVNGAPVTVTSATGEDELLAFDGTAGTRLSAMLSNSTISTTTVTVRAPDGSTVATKSLSTGDAFIDTVVLPQTGTYVVTVHPLGTTGGSMTLQLYAVPPDAADTILPGGAPLTLTTTVPGQNAVATFTGIAGQRVALGTQSQISFLKTTISGPDGTLLGGPLYTSAGSGFIDTVQLPANGTYTILADPQDERTGSVTLTLYAVPADVTTPIQPGGAAASLSVGSVGQNALFTFAGTAGQRVSMNVTTDAFLVKTTLVAPDGTVVGGASYGGQGTFFVDVRTLPQTGNYTIVADPQNTYTGTVTISLFSVPPDPTTTTTIGGTPVTLTTTTPGQNATATFQGTAGAQVSVSYSLSGMAASVSLVGPTGTTLAYGSSGFIPSTTLPTTGTYTLLVDPQGAAFGSATLQVTNVPVDFTGSLTMGGAPLTITLAVAQNARITFAGAAGHRLSLAVSGSSLPQTKLDIKAPDGSEFTTFYVASNGGFLDTKTLPQTGTYTIFITPSGGSPVTMTLTAYDVPADATAQAVAGGASVPVSIAVPGQNASVTFAGTAGHRVSFNFTMSMSVRITVLRPDGATLVSQVAPGNTFIDVQPLPLTGTYTILLDPFDQATGPITTTVYDVPADVTGTITQGGAGLPVSMPVPGEGAAISLAETAGQPFTLTLSNVTVPIMRVSVLNPDGTTLIGPSWVLGSTTFALTAPTAGTYTIVLDPYSNYTGNATVSAL